MSRLYLAHFGLRQPPFDITPNPHFFFVGGQRGALLDGIAHAVFDTPGIILVIGEVGSGKTMLCRMLAQRLRDRCTLIYLANPSFGPQEILRAIVADIGLTPATGEPLPLTLQRALLAQHQQGRQAVLLIDEAQAMPPESIEEVKLLSNLETGPHKLLQIVLFGQPELDDVLDQARLRQVRDRVVHRFTIPPLSADDASRYLDHRLACAGSAGADLFDADARRLLVTRAGGSVRQLNILADQALLAAYAAGAPRVQRAHIEKVLQPFATAAPAQATVARARPLRLSRQAAWIGVAGIGLGILAGWWLGQRPASTVTARANASSPAEAGATTLPVHTPMDASPSKSPSPAGVPVKNPAAPAPALPDASTGDTHTAPRSPEAAQAAAAPGMRDRYANLDPALRQIVLDSRAILDDPNRSGYTLQISTGSDSRAIQRWMTLPRPDGWPLWIHDRQYANSSAPVWAIYLGWFETRAAALAARHSLSAEWTRDKPQIRTLAAIRAEQYPEQTPR